ncbi:DUF6118 family protein [Methylobacterium sp. MA0201]|jgi:hypothetical protein|uniref:DUF6118 family protein n=1 Tax=Methylobacterium alsaeris TaxID=3344826 RepID=UPI00375694AC
MADQVDDLEENGPDEATQAFRDLTREVADVRAELSIMRRAVEAIGPALGDIRPPDYSPTLADITTLQKAIVVAIQKIEKHPAIQVGPEAYAARAAQAIEQSVRGTLRDAEGTAHAIRGSARDVEAVLKSARTREAQNRRLAQVGAVGIAIGLVLFPLFGFPLARVLPFGSLPDSLAAAALGEDRWNAGMGLMQRANPQQWNGLVQAYNTVRVAGDELRGCQEAAAKVGKDQRCTITVKSQ